MKDKTKEESKKPSHKRHKSNMREKPFNTKQTTPKRVLEPVHEGEDVIIKPRA